MTLAKSPVPQVVSAELARVVQRWQQLPLDDATSSAGQVRQVVQRWADAVADAAGDPRTPVPDLGPGVLMDQLTVVVFDACAAVVATGIEADLARLRRRL